MAKPRSREEWIRLLSQDIVQAMLPQDQIEFFKRKAREDPLFANMSDEDLVKARNNFQAEVQAARQARQIGKVRIEPHQWTRAEQRTDISEQAKETAHPGDVYRATTSQTVGRIPFGIGPRVEDFLNTAAAALIKGVGGGITRSAGTLAELKTKYGVTEEEEQDRPFLAPPPMFKRRETTPEKEAAGREAARPFMEAAESIDAFADRFDKPNRVSFNEWWKNKGAVEKLRSAPELVVQTLGDVTGYALPYILGPGKYRDLYLYATGISEISERSFEDSGSTQPEYTIPAAGIFAIIERAFGPEAWSRAVSKNVTGPAKKFVETFLKDPKRLKGLAHNIILNFFRYGAPEAVTEGVQEYIVTQAANADEPALTLDTWNTLPEDDKAQITEAFGATLLSLGLVGMVKGRRGKTEAPALDVGPQIEAGHNPEIAEPTPESQAVLAPVIDRYQTRASNMAANPDERARWEAAASSVRMAEPSDGYTLAARQLAERAGMRVTFFVDQVPMDQETGRTAPGIRSVVMNNQTGDLLIRLDPNNSRAAAGNIVKGMVVSLAARDPARMKVIAEKLKRINPQLYESAKSAAEKRGIKDDLGILAIAAELSASDIITAFSAPDVTGEAARGELGSSEIFTSVKDTIASVGRNVVENIINPRLVNSLHPGSLRYAMSGMTDVPLIVRDVEGQKVLAETAQMFAQEAFPDGSYRMELSPSENQPIVFASTEAGGASDFQVGTNITTERGTFISRFVDRMFQKWMDDRLMQKDVERQVREQGIPLTDNISMSQTIDTQNSRVAEAARNIQEDKLKRLEDILVNRLPPNSNIRSEFEELGQYLTARTALERNRFLRDRDLTDADKSGMSDEEALVIIARAEANGRAEIYDAALAVALEVPNITLREMMDSGLITPEEYAAMRAAHPRYLPMKSKWMQEAMGPATSQKILEDETGKPVDVNTDHLAKRLHGFFGKRDITHPIRQLFADSLLRIDMAERNRTMQTIYRFAEKFGGGTIKTYKGEPAPWGDPRRNTQLRVYFNGEPHVIEFQSVEQRNQFANLSNRKLHTFFRVASKLTNLQARAATTFSIPFWFVNFPRDLITAYTQSPSAEMGIQTIKNAPRAFQAIVAVEFPQFMPQAPSPQLAEQIQRYQMYRENGGQLSFMGLREMYRDINKLVHKLGDDRVGVVYRARQFVDLMDNMSSVLENTTRFAAFNAALDNGATPRAAAYYARNITVDFDRKTDSARKLNALYVFANANLQGTARIMRAMWHSPHGRKTMMQFGMYGFLAALMSRVTAPEEWEKISDDEKARNLIFLNPDGTYNKIPLPPGLASLFRMGSFAEELAFDDKPRSKLDTLLTPLGVMLDEFSPLAPSRLSGSGIGQGNWYSWLRMFIPSGAQWAFDISQNQSVWGQEIHPEPGKYDKYTPRTELMFGDEKSSLQREFFARPLTKWINRVNGGDDRWPGTWGDTDIPGEEWRADYSPETFEYFLETFFSGPLAFTNRSWKLAKHFANVAQDKEVPPIHENMIPVVRRFHSRATDYEIGDEYYSIRDRVSQAQTYMNDFESGEIPPEQFDKWYERNGWLLDIAPMIDETEKELTEIRQNRTESTYRADSERRMKLQRQVVEEFYDLWSGAKEKRGADIYKNADVGQRFYDETSVQAADTQMTMLNQMLTMRGNEEARKKYIENHGWKMKVMPAYRKWFEVSTNPDKYSEETLKAVTRQFLDAYYDAEEQERKKTPAGAGAGVRF